MFGKLRLKQRMYLQFFMAVLPLAIVFSYQMLSTSDLPAKVNKILSIYDLSLRASENYKSFLNGLVDAVDTGSISSKTLSSLSATKTVVDELATASPSGNVATAAEALTKIQAAIAAKNSLDSVTPLKSDINSIDAALTGKIADIKMQLSTLVEDDAKTTHKKNQISIYVALATLLLLVFIIRQLVNGVTTPLALAVGTARRVSEGDLTSDIAVVRQDEIGELQRALLEMNKALIAIVGDVRSASEQITTGTDEMVSGNSDLSMRTEQQAASLENTAASITQLTTAIGHNADNSQLANELAVNASEVAIKGGKVVGQVVETMNLINDSSKKVGEIISVIENIAFQTNILALNAAVEAARAGEQGRGFAVVATEVRNLAQRSAAAAKEIKAMIGNSVDKVSSGTKLVKEAGETMQDIVTAVARVTEMMAEIQAASAEQKDGIGQVNEAVHQMDEMTQQNAALVEQAMAIAESVHDQTKKLTEAVEKFKIPRIEMAAESSEWKSQPGSLSANKPKIRTSAIQSRIKLLR
ncbi:MAG: methyl-accepting chemotaxis protein [Gallionella sp.]